MQKIKHIIPRIVSKIKQILCQHDYSDIAGWEWYPSYPNDGDPCAVKIQFVCTHCRKSCYYWLYNDTAKSWVKTHVGDGPGYEVNLE